MTKQREYDLEDRLIAFADSAIDVAESVPNTRAGFLLSEQLIRSATSSALNYGEAQGAESKRDFIHKMGVILKELRESSINLKLLIHRRMITDDKTLKENRELIAIFVASIQTAKRNIS
jgi:four helix bundle protein